MAYMKAKPGKSLQEKRPEIAEYWDHKNNTEFTPEDVPVLSGYTASWKCDKGHKWSARVSSFTKRDTFNGCPVCRGALIQKGVNDLFTLRPAIIDFWNWEKNVDINPYTMGPSSHKLIWLTCKNGHELHKVLDFRTIDGIGCAYCYGTAVVKGVTDLATKRPDIAKEFHPTLNGDKKASDYTSSSQKKVWWKCEKYGHEWEASIGSRTHKKQRNCPTCGNRRFLQGFNDLETRYPEIAKEFDVAKNGMLPSEIKAGGRVPLWWICKTNNAHKWNALLNNRISVSSGCPYCKLNSTSKIETAISDELKRRGVLLGTDKDFSNKLYIPWQKRKFIKVDIAGYIFTKSNKKINIAIEYDGAWWHEGREETDISKTETLLKNGYRVIRVREGRLDFLDYDHENLLQMNTPRRNSYKDVIELTNMIEAEINKFLK
jgi:hypothetical protein